MNLTHEQIEQLGNVVLYDLSSAGIKSVVVDGFHVVPGQWCAFRSNVLVYGSFAFDMDDVKPGVLAKVIKVRLKNTLQEMRDLINNDLAILDKL